jgi:LysR family transcriptional regulator, hydrogen peroxide-inducible genes activator
MTLTQLSYIVAVAKHRHFGAAAESCFVTQPTLSMQVQKLEEELGIEIFDRSHQPISTTPLGAALVEQAQVVLAEADKMKALSAEEVDVIADVIKIAVIPTLSPTLAPKIVDWFARHHPKTEISLEELQTKDLMARLKDGSIDLGLVVTPLEDPHLLEKPLFYEPFYLYVAADHPISKFKSVTSDSLHLDDLWLLTEGHCFRDQALKVCGDRKRRKSASRAMFESGSLETLRKMVDRSGGYTLIPALTLEDLDESRRKKQVREFVAPAPSREVSLVHSRVYKRRATLEAISQAVREGLPKEYLKLDLKRLNRIDL